MKEEKTAEQVRLERAGKTDGRLFRPTEDDLKPGNVLRMINPSDESVPSFSDMTVLKVESGNVKLARPYVFASSIGTTSPVPLVGVETFDVTKESILAKDSLFRTVVQTTGIPANLVT